MRLTIVKDDNTVIVDGERHAVDLSDLSADFHALQWAGEDGEVEYASVRCPHCGTRSKKLNEAVVDFAPWRPYVDRWYAAKAAVEKARAEQEAAIEKAKNDAAG